MPNIKSAKKRVLVIKKKTLINQMHKTAMKTAVKKFETAVENNDTENAKVLFNNAVKKLDQGVKQGILHKNNAAKKKVSARFKAGKNGRVIQQRVEFFGSLFLYRKHFYY